MGESGNRHSVRNANVNPVRGCIWLSVIKVRQQTRVSGKYAASVDSVNGRKRGGGVGKSLGYLVVSLPSLGHGFLSSSPVRIIEQGSKWVLKGADSPALCHHHVFHPYSQDFLLAPLI